MFNFKSAIFFTSLFFGLAFNSILLGSEELPCPPQGQVAEQVAQTSKQLDRSLKQKHFHFIGDQKHPISFSFEVEFNLVISPEILNYYHLENFTPEQWMLLSLDKRRELVQKKIRYFDIPGRNILKRMPETPDFLAKFLQIAEEGRVELANNLITNDLNELNEALSWLDKRVKYGSYQGHAAFDIVEGVDLSSVADTIKMDHDLALVESLNFGLQKYEKSGAIPGAQFTHLYLQPMQGTHFNKTQKKLQIPKSNVIKNRKLKRVYGTVYRPDLYGQKKVGFEVRHCHTRINCIMEKLEMIASDLSQSKRSKPFIDLPQINDDLILSISTDNFNKLKELTKLIPGQFSSLEEKALNFLWPFTNFEHSPHFLSLPIEHVEKASFRLSTARTLYGKALHDIINAGDLYPHQKLEKLQVALAQFVKDSELESFLKMGQKASHTIVEETRSYSLPVWAAAFFQVPKAVDSEKLWKKIQDIFAKLSPDRIKEIKKALLSNEFEARAGLYKMLESWPEESLILAWQEMNVGKLGKRWRELSDEGRDFLVQAIHEVQKNNADGLKPFLHSMQDETFESYEIYFRDKKGVVNPKRLSEIWAAPLFRRAPIFISEDKKLLKIIF